jgi:hypothetical protein
MSTLAFGVTKQPVYGTYGEFTVGKDKFAIRAQFLLTKVRPSNDGTWESDFAGMMVPWREVFKLEDMNFDELLQRDLDDSRVAHDLVPYLLGEQGSTARFFPPVLAVLVPRNASGSGIEAYYPPIKGTATAEKADFGDLFSFNAVVLNGETTPLGIISYNRQKTAFVIVDGQHRAMAVLALYRQITKSWGNSAYESYYHHINIKPEDVKSIELPVCLLFFPDLTSDNAGLITKGIDLRHVCREIFLVVNKNAKQVSESRQLLLDDDDFCARMLRKTLSKLKDRGPDQVSLAKIQSISYGDSEDVGKAVVAGQLDFSSAIALHKLHMIASFGNPAIFKWVGHADATDRRSLRNPSRPAEILTGTPLGHWHSLSRDSAMEHNPSEVEKAVSLLGDVTDSIVMGLFDNFRPFSIHNEAVSLIRVKLSQPESKADVVQRKCFNLLFEGSGVRAVFEEHSKRLDRIKQEAAEENKELPQFIKQQIEYCRSVEVALQGHESEIRRRRACSLFNINYDGIQAAADCIDKWRVIEARAKSIFDTISTQAFQIGFQMAVLTVAQDLLAASVKYDERVSVIRNITDMFVDCLNVYFSPLNDTKHNTLTGYIEDKRVKIFDSQSLGLRGLLRMSVNELNERQWPFFRFLIMEVVHCPVASKPIMERFVAASPGSFEELYKAKLLDILTDVAKVRASYISDAEEASMKTSEFKTKLLTTEVQKKAEGIEEKDVVKALELLKKEQRQIARDQAKAHLRATLGKIETPQQIANRILGIDSGMSAEEEMTETPQVVQESVELPVAVDEAPAAEAPATDPE